MKNLKKIISLVLVVIVLTALSLSIAGCGPKETATYYIKNVSGDTLTVKLLKDYKVLETFSNVKDGDTIEFNVEITNKVNVFKCWYAGAALGRVELHPEDGYVDGGTYNIVKYQTGSSSNVNYILEPGN